MKEAAPARDRLRLIARQGEGWVVRLQAHDGAPVERMMERSGWTPLPPYILRARAERHAQQDDDADRAWYQTVFAHTNAAGDPAMERSVAAPTAGLHFTPELLARLHAQGVERLEVTLSVGAGTFKPVETATLAEHPMHRERCHVPAQTLRALRALTGPRAAGQARLVAVGTTSVRTLESLPNPLPERPPPLCAVGATAHAGTSHAIAGYAAADHNTAGYAADGWSMDTRLLIQPGHSFRYVDALLTNFHLPRSTLLALVGALVGLDRLKELYALAQERGYRFFSYGDAMLIL